MSSIVNIAAALLIAALQTQAPAPAAQTTTEKPAFERAPDALERVTWRTRTLVGVMTASRSGSSPFPAAASLSSRPSSEPMPRWWTSWKARTPRVNLQLPKMLDSNLTADEIAAIRGRMGPVRMLTYRVDRLDAAPASRRKVFEFVKAMGADTLSRRPTRRSRAWRAWRTNSASTSRCSPIPPDQTCPLDEGARGAQQAARRRHRHGALGPGRPLATRRPGGRQRQAVVL